MEKFMLIFHGGLGADASPAEMQESMGKWFAWINQLAAEDRYVSGEPLFPGGKIISGKGGKSVTDGPFTEGKEVVGGYFIVNAKDYDDAISLCGGYPDYEIGGQVQVRQVMKVDMPG